MAADIDRVALNKLTREALIDVARVWLPESRFNAYHMKEIVEFILSSFVRSLIRSFARRALGSRSIYLSRAGTRALGGAACRRGLCSYVLVD